MNHFKRLLTQLKRKITEIDTEPGPQKKKHNSGHTIGFDKTWQTNRQWLIFTDNSMNCSLCSEFQKESAWATMGVKLYAWTKSRNTKKVQNT